MAKDLAAVFVCMLDAHFVYVKFADENGALARSVAAARAIRHPQRFGALVAAGWLRLKQRPHLAPSCNRLSGTLFAVLQSTVVCWAGRGLGLLRLKPNWTEHNG